MLVVLTGKFIIINGCQEKVFYKQSEYTIFELGEKFLGQGTWEQDMLDQVNSMDTEQRGQVYRRVFGQ